MKFIFNALLVLFFSLAQDATAAPITGRVIGITDGDTLTVLTPAKRQVRVRLADIDAPERGQPYASKSKRELSRLCYRKQAKVVVRTRDRYGRIVGRTYCAGIDASAEMVRRGAAWVYRRYNRDPRLYAIERQARQARRGLWRLPEAARVPPWRWRHGNWRRPATRRQAPAAAFTCGRKYYCRQMSSCAEARFYYRQCGLFRLDGDRDGVPCERLCRR